MRVRAVLLSVVGTVKQSSRDVINNCWRDQDSEFEKLIITTFHSFQFKALYLRW